MKYQDEKYLARGVSHQKKDVHEAIKNVNSKQRTIDAFCKVTPNPFFDFGKEDYFLLHADGAGTKSSLAYLYWKETGDISVFSSIAQDALIMNTDDMMCVGAIDNFAFSSTIGRNKHLIPGEVISAIIEGNQKMVDNLQQNGINCQMMGGETADVGDLVQTLIVDATAAAFVKKNKFIQTHSISPNLVILGLSSFGKASYEEQYNSGIGSNGLTSARHDLLHTSYRKKYPETFSSNTNLEYIYNGHYYIEDILDKTPLNIGQALLSPTRTYLPVIKKIFAEHFDDIKSMIHCTGGGQTKCLKFGKNIHFIKDNLFDFPPLFELLKETTNYKEFFQSF